MFEPREESDKYFDQKRLKVSKQFINEVREKESRKKTPKHLIDTCLKAAKKYLKNKD